MKQYYKIIYNRGIGAEDVLDWMEVWADSFADAVEEFVKVPQKFAGYCFTYNKHNIRSISVR